MRGEMATSQQQEIVPVPQPVLEPTFSERSYGFRPMGTPHPSAANGALF